jgi:hypothetical protein
VIRYGTDFHEAPLINVMVEFFKDDPIVNDLLRFKRDLGERFVFGLLCTEDPEDDLVMNVYPNRRPNLERLAAVADFIWTLLPVEHFYAPLCGADRVALLRYGFSREHLEPDIIADARARDIDVLLYGNPHPHRQAVVSALAAAGLNCVTTQREAYPEFAAADLVRRAKLLLEVRRSADVRFLSPTRLMKALHAGTAIVAERFDDSALAELYAYTIPCDYADIAATCRKLIGDGMYVERGLQALAKFQAETSMQERVQQALALPVFRRLAEAAS